MSDVKRRIEKLEAQTSGGDDQFTGPVIQRPGETVLEAARRCGYTEAMIERGGFIVLPEKDGWEVVNEQAGNEDRATGGPER